MCNKHCQGILRKPMRPRQRRREHANLTNPLNSALERCCFAVSFPSVTHSGAYPPSMPMDRLIFTKTMPEWFYRYLREAHDRTTRCYAPVDSGEWHVGGCAAERVERETRRRRASAARVTNRQIIRNLLHKKQKNLRLPILKNVKQRKNLRLRLYKPVHICYNWRVLFFRGGFHARQLHTLQLALLPRHCHPFNGSNAGASA